MLFAHEGRRLCRPRFLCILLNVASPYYASIYLAAIKRNQCASVLPSVDRREQVDKLVES